MERKPRRIIEIQHDIDRLQDLNHLSVLSVALVELQSAFVFERDVWLVPEL
jgi:hypothetical protein